jgi:hypothetical protein
MPVPENAELVWDYLITHGLTVNAVAGILGNIEQESGGSPTAGEWPGSDEIGYGLIQWTPPTRYFPASPPSLDEQLPAIIKYINGNGGIANVNANAPNPSAAALYFSEKYERPLASEANNPNRMQSAVDVYNAAQAGHWTGTAGAPPPQPTAHPPAVAVSSTGEVNVFWRGLAGFLWQGQGSGSGDLKGTRLGFGPMATGPAAGVDAQGHIFVYWEGTDGNLWEAYFDGSAWQQANRGYGELGSAPAVAVNSDGEVNVFWAGLGHYLWQGQGSGSGDLKGTRLGFGPMATGPAAGVDAQGHINVFWVGTDGDLWEAFWDGSAWQGPFNRGYGEIG